jgi:hypothetical protein
MARRGQRQIWWFDFGHGLGVAVHSAIPMETQSTDTDVGVKSQKVSQRPCNGPSSTARFCCMVHWYAVQYWQPRRHRASVPEPPASRSSTLAVCELKPRRQSLKTRSVEQNTNNSATSSLIARATKRPRLPVFPQLLAEYGRAACISVGTLRLWCG